MLRQKQNNCKGEIKKIKIKIVKSSIALSTHLLFVQDVMESKNDP